MPQSFNTSTIWAPFGPFSHGVVLQDGVTVHLKGQIPLDREGRLQGKGDMAAQLRLVLENLQSVLKSVGGRMSDIVSLTQYTTDIEAFMKAGDVRRAFFEAPYPVTTTLGVVRLYDPEVLVEISAVAEIARDRFKQPPISHA
jgi:enamine deaminase RidA (YjgF/YER057c/UK114 family)